MTTTESKAHADLGASIAERWMNCLGSVDLIRKMKAVSASNFYAAEGTLAHSVAANILRSDLLGLPIEEGEPIQYGTVHEIEGIEITITDEMLDAVQEYVDFVTDIAKETSEIGVESEVHIPNLHVTGIPENELWGTADFWAYEPFTRLHVVDYKHGKGIRVNPYENKQLLFYALGVWETHLSQFERDNTPEIHLTIVQPRSPGGGVTTWVITPAELMAFGNELLDKASQVKPDAPLTAGSWCRWCPAKAECPAIKGFVEEQTQQDFALMVPTVSGLPAPRTFTEQMLANVVTHKKLIISWLEDIEKEAQNRLEMGVEIPGYKLVQPVKHRKWEDEEKVINILTEEYKFEMDDIHTTPKLKSPNQIKELAKKKKVKFDVDNYAYKPDGEPVIAPIFDKRPEVKLIESND